MNGIQLVNGPAVHCFVFPLFALNLDWSGLFWLGLLIFVFEILLLTIIRLKHIYFPPRFLLAIMIFSAVILAEALPYLYLTGSSHPC
jgi:hypothetical protein